MQKINSPTEFANKAELDNTDSSILNEKRNNDENIILKTESNKNVDPVENNCKSNETFNVDSIDNTNIKHDMINSIETKAREDHPSIQDDNSIQNSLLNNCTNKLPIPELDTNFATSGEEKQLSPESEQQTIIPITPQIISQSKKTNKFLPAQSSRTNPLFEEFKIDKPAVNLTNKFTSIKNNFNKLSFVNSESSTTSSTSSDDEQNSQKFFLSSNSPSSLNLPPLTKRLSYNNDKPSHPFQQLSSRPILSDLEPKKETNPQQNKERDYYSENYDYNETETEDYEEDESGNDNNNTDFAIRSSSDNNSAKILNSNQNQENNLNFTSNTDSNFNSISKNSNHQSSTAAPTNLNQAQPQHQVQLPNRQKHSLQKKYKIKNDNFLFNDKIINDAFMFLEEYHNIKTKERKNKNTDQNETIELTNKGVPFYSIKREILDNEISNTFPTDPIKPLPNKSTGMEMMMGMTGVGFDDQIYNNYGFGGDFDNNLDREAQNEFKINLEDENNNDNKNTFQNFANSYNFEIAPYLQPKQQPDLEPNIEKQKVENISENDDQAHDSNDSIDNDFETNENIDSIRERNRGRSRYYQQNNDFNSDNDYDFENYEPDENSSKANRGTQIINNIHNQNNSSKLGGPKKENGNYHIFTDQQKKAKSKQISAEAFKEIPFHPISTDDLYALMMNSMVYDEKKIMK